METARGASEHPPLLVHGLFPTEARFAEPGGSIVHHVDESSMPSHPAIN